MGALEPAGPWGLATCQHQRQLDRALGRLNAEGQLAVAHVEQQANLQAARVAAVRYVGVKALEATALLSEWEQQLGRLSPLAVGRLQSVADLTTLGLAEVVADTTRRVR